MKEYNYLDIIKIDETGILFSDNVFVSFEECRYGWAEENNISKADTVCVASRFLDDKDRYFIFYSEERVKLLFRIKGIFKSKKSLHRFQEVQILLNRFGYSSYDMS